MYTVFECSVYNVGSVQCQQCSESIASVQFLKRSVYSIEFVAYIVNGVQC